MFLSNQRATHIRIYSLKPYKLYENLLFIFQLLLWCRLFALIFSRSVFSAYILSYLLICSEYFLCNSTKVMITLSSNEELKAECCKILDKNLEYFWYYYEQKNEKIPRAFTLSQVGLYQTLTLSPRISIKTVYVDFVFRIFFLDLRCKQGLRKYVTISHWYLCQWVFGNVVACFLAL